MSLSNGIRPANDPSQRLRTAAAEAVRLSAEDRRRSTLYAKPVIDRAAALLVDLWAAGEKHGVGPGEWNAVAHLSSDVLDVLRYPIPQVPEDAEDAVDRALAAARALRGLGAASRRDLFSISLHPTEHSLPCNPTATYGGWFVLSLDREIGWSVWVARHGTSRAVTIRAGFDDAGVMAAVEVAVDANEGAFGDSLLERR